MKRKPKWLTLIHEKSVKKLVWFSLNKTLWRE